MYIAHCRWTWASNALSALISFRRRAFCSQLILENASLYSFRNTTPGARATSDVEQGLDTAYCADHQQCGIGKLRKPRSRRHLFEAWWIWSAEAASRLFQRDAEKLHSLTASSLMTSSRSIYHTPIIRFIVVQFSLSLFLFTYLYNFVVICVLFYCVYFMYLFCVL